MRFGILKQNKSSKYASDALEKKNIPKHPKCSNTNSKRIFKNSKLEMFWKIYFQQILLLHILYNFAKFQKFGY